MSVVREFILSAARSPVAHGMAFAAWIGGAYAWGYAEGVATQKARVITALVNTDAEVSAIQLRRAVLTALDETVSIDPP